MNVPKVIFAIPLMLIATPAFGQPVLENLAYSYPKAGAAEVEPVRLIQLSFDGAVDLVSVEIGYPDDTTTEIYNAFTDYFPMKKSETFAITLPVPLTAPGRYSVSYAVSMTRANSTTDSNVGSYEFTVRLPGQEPDCAAARADADTCTGPGE